MNESIYTGTSEGIPYLRRPLTKKMGVLIKEQADMCKRVGIVAFVYNDSMPL